MPHSNRLGLSRSVALRARLLPAPQRAARTRQARRLHEARGQFQEMSNIDRYVGFQTCQTDFITAPPLAFIGDRECCMLPANIGMHHAHNSNRTTI